MTNNNQLALVVAYYLSRCNKSAYTSLGYSNFSMAAKEIGAILGVKASTIKNMRDEFDPHHDNDRIGWLRELRPSRLKVLGSFQETDDDALLEIVKAILFDEEFKRSEEYKEIETLFEDKKNPEVKREPIFILRGPTGRKAELFFIEYFNRNRKPIKGELVDRRDEGCGYDFEITDGDDSYYIEVKGLAAESGGILFTNKEWQMAIKNQDRYFVVLVSNLSHDPKIRFIQNPSTKLKMKKNIYTTVQLNWSVSQKELGNMFKNENIT